MRVSESFINFFCATFWHVNLRVSFINVICSTSVLHVFNNSIFRVRGLDRNIAVSDRPSPFTYSVRLFSSSSSALLSSVNGFLCVYFVDFCVWLYVVGV